MRFLAFLGFLGAALQALLAVLMVTMSGLSEVPFGSLLGLFYLLTAVLYFSTSLRLSGSAAAIRRIRGGGGAEALAEAARLQSSLWRLLGMFSVLMLLIVGGAVVLGVGAGIVSLR